MMLPSMFRTGLLDVFVEVAEGPLPVLDQLFQFVADLQSYPPAGLPLSDRDVELLPLSHRDPERLLLSSRHGGIDLEPHLAHVA